MKEIVLNYATYLIVIYCLSVVLFVIALVIEKKITVFELLISVFVLMIPIFNFLIMFYTVIEVMNRKGFVDLKQIKIKFLQFLNKRII